jgi:hypothetical protein
VCGGLAASVRHRTDAGHLRAYIGCMQIAGNVHTNDRVDSTPAEPVAELKDFEPSGAMRPTCPLCKGALIRVWRRPIDRFTSLFVPVHRFRCEGFSCGWEGNFRVDAADRASTTLLERAARLSVVALLLVISGALAAVLVIATTGWFSAYDRERTTVGLRENQCMAAISAFSPPIGAHCAITASTG